MYKKFVFVATLVFLGCANQTAKTVDVYVQNNRSSAVINFRIGSTSYGNIAAGARSAARALSPGTHSVSSDSGESGSVTIPESKSTATVVIASNGALSVQ